MEPETASRTPEKDMIHLAYVAPSGLGFAFIDLIQARRAGTYPRETGRITRFATIGNPRFWRIESCGGLFQRLNSRL